MNELLPILEGWFWWVTAGVLLILELSSPGVFFIWLAVAAALTGAVGHFVALGWQGEVLAFAGFSLAAIFAGKPLLTRRRVLDSDRPNLNQRHHGYVGQRYALHQPINDGHGRIKIDDTIWEIQGPDLPAGAYVKVTGVDGLRLTVVRD